MQSGTKASYLLHPLYEENTYLEQFVDRLKNRLKGPLAFPVPVLYSMTP